MLVRPPDTSYIPNLIHTITKYLTFLIGSISMGLFSWFKKKTDQPKNKETDIQSDDQDLSKPKTTDQFKELSQKSYAYLNKQQELTEERYGIGQYENWFYDQETGYLTFSDGDTAKIKIKYESVGSISKHSETWLWSWANPHLEDGIKTDILAVKAYGEQQELEPLTKRKWYADEYDGWEMTAIAAYLMQAKGAYRVPTENTFSFMLFKEIIDLRDE